MSKYIKDACRTESIVGAKERFGKVINTIDGLLLTLMVVNKDVDNLKKYVFYGKECDTLDTNTLALDLNISEEKIRLLHAGLGMLTEAEEFLTPVINSILKSTDLDKVNLSEEIGDMQWYQAIACDVLGTTLEIEQERNIRKLKTRYPDRYSDDAAINRDVEVERKVLESNKLPECEVAPERIESISLEDYPATLTTGIRIYTNYGNTLELNCPIKLNMLNDRVNRVLQWRGSTVKDLKKYLKTFN